ncbi:hypothetical protein COT75_04860 [Candidatus Beckwithbacteria bacterium CG10_big_fil_rev_8_21_14_0_10_34_10]|uniref:CAAX prenyl protease 2/Lysostaphin resistance protein A-like domain-containing protein n=1 Tax=Candidatus Beckwithbacteria bacterium CG10_big_fil_rev_8_21_14_0_10_34_10 TaxID=1974495 RepID=A0A2H0W7Y5_9BACT|nr:MAG: hypothetical protein COT75_04860 [Candidatus Beckwithbacteria bacterium CG10_big_fil_rev_8_21_14_0_10_34_10]
MEKKTKNLLVLVYFFYLFSIWGIYRYLSNLSEPWDELIFKPILWLLPIFLIVKRIEKKQLKSLGIVFLKFWKNILIGLGISIFILFEYLLSLVIKGKPISFNPLNLGLIAFLIYSLSAFFTAVSEEIVFRGFLMTRINKVINSKLGSNIIVGILFFVIHLPILIFDQSQTFLGLGKHLSLAIGLGLIDGYVFWKTKGIIAPIVAHASLNIFSLLIG